MSHIIMLVFSINWEIIFIYTKFFMHNIIIAISILGINQFVIKIYMFIGLCHSAGIDCFPILVKSLGQTYRKTSFDAGY